jgi:hypothetical protein
MWQFIISGYIPGTNYRITLDTLGIIAGIIVCMYLLRILAREIHATDSVESASSIEAKTI